MKAKRRKVLKSSPKPYTHKPRYEHESVTTSVPNGRMSASELRAWFERWAPIIRSLANHLDMGVAVEPNGETHRLLLDARRKSDN